ncbi:MAG: hypothetical protein CVU38_02440 [Chloroflexi bacterium HGW-Chloroflexi-1]|nr:MAG: hypothetical protein CVU38_02440 [Chloroflexi bacterium HGW-Chloroflexi-1]
MASSQKRLDLRIDIFEKTDQQALALPELKPPQLVETILQEFRELEYLGDTPADYRLVRAADGYPLDDETPIGQQGLQEGARLRLEEIDLPLPEGAGRPSQPIYLREPRMGQAYRIHWQPAIIGRASERQPLNELVAVDLKSYTTGLRVSRRHVKLTEQDGVWYAENLSGNPASLVPQDGSAAIPLGARRQALHPGDALRLDRSDLALKFIVRAQPAAPVAAEAGAISPAEKAADG